MLTQSALAALADGEEHERKRAQIKRVADGCSQPDEQNLPTRCQDVLMERVPQLPDVVM